MVEPMESGDTGDEDGQKLKIWRDSVVVYPKSVPLGFGTWMVRGFPDFSESECFEVCEEDCCG